LIVLKSAKEIPVICYIGQYVITLELLDAQTPKKNCNVKKDSETYNTTKYTEEYVCNIDNNANELIVSEKDTKQEAIMTQ